MLRSGLIIGLFAVSATASAEGFDYNYFSLGYGNVDFDDINVDGNGFGLEGSYALADDWHVFAGYSDTSLDLNIDATSWNAGIGFNTPISDVVDVVARFSYEYVDFDGPGPGSADDNGFGMLIGLRFAATEELELNAGISYVDLSDSGDDTGFGAGALYNFTDRFAAGLSGNWDDDGSSYTWSARYYFGR